MTVPIMRREGRFYVIKYANKFRFLCVKGWW